MLVLFIEYRHVYSAGREGERNNMIDLNESNRSLNVAMSES